MVFSLIFSNKKKEKDLFCKNFPVENWKPNIQTQQIQTLWNWVVDIQVEIFLLSKTKFWKQTDNISCISKKSLHCLNMRGKRLRVSGSDKLTARWLTGTFPNQLPGLSLTPGMASHVN